MSQPQPQVLPVEEPAHPPEATEAGPSTGPTPVPPPATHQTTTTTTTTTAAEPNTTRAENAPSHPAILPTSTAATLVTNNNEPQTFYEKLNAGDRQWKWKIGMRAIIMIVNFIGLGCAAWVVANFTTQARYTYFNLENYDQELIPWVLITFSLSILWGTACLWVFFMTDSHRQMHPGAQVAVDLLLWIGFLCTALCAGTATLAVASFGGGGSIQPTRDSRSSDPRWVYQPGNNSWVSDYPTSSSSTVRDCTSTSSSSSSYQGNPFTSCADMDAYVNLLWHTKGARFNSELTAAVCQLIALLLHFALFVWACVDTHRKNKSKIGKDAEKLAADIVQTMIKNGAIIPPPGQAYARPMAVPQGYPLLYPQFVPQPVPQATQSPPTIAQSPGGKLPPQEQPSLVSEGRKEKGRFA